MHVEHFMTKNPIACDVDDTVEIAARHMRDKGVGSVVVLENGKVAGIITDRQITVNALGNGKSGDTAVSEVMTHSPATLTLEDNLFSAVDTMRSAGVARRIPVVNEENELLGVVSISDVALIAKDLSEAVFLEETHHALEETHILTGAKELVKNIRRPTKAERLPPQAPIRAVTTPTPEGPPPKSGMSGAPAPSEREAPGQR
jgi:CBS domain-containing protein